MILLQALKVHFVSFAVLLSFWLPIFHFTHYFHPFQLAVMEGLIACVLGMRLKMPLWWIPINMFFVPFVVVVYSFQIPPSIGLSLIHI